MTLSSSQNQYAYRQSRPKLSHIAKLANTTPSTVSKVINGRSGVSDETRQRIEALLKDMEIQQTASQTRAVHNHHVGARIHGQPMGARHHARSHRHRRQTKHDRDHLREKRLRRQPQRHLPASNPSSQTQSSDFRQRLRANARSNALPRTWSSICGSRPIRNTMQRLHGCAHRQLDRRIRNRQPSY